MPDLIRTGIGFDSHRFAEGRDLILGGVRIEHVAGLDGHSDADVLCHAISDALLGAVAEGDIGTHFPDTDPAWKDADSILLLRACAELVRSTDADIHNVDATVMAEAPKLAPHIRDICDSLAAALDLPADRVSVKATTLEQMGSLGRGEGIGVLAIATVSQKVAE